MVANLILLICAITTIYISRILFDAFVLHKRLRLAFNKKLLGVACLTNTLAMMIVSIAAMPLIDYSWAIFLIQIIFLIAIEAPLYQIYFRNKSWYELCINLLLSRFIFAFITFGVGIIAIFILRGSLQ